MKKHIINGVLCLALSACGNSKDRSTNNGGVSQQPQGDSSTGNTYQPSEPPYSKFYYRVMDSCTKANPTYRYISVQDILMPVYLDGRQMMASIQIFLNADHSFAYEYEERQVMYRVPDGYGYNVVLSASFSGRWEQRGNILVLGQLGTAQETVYNGKPALKLFLDNDIREGSGLKSYAALALAITSTEGKKHFPNICK